MLGKIKTCHYKTVLFIFINFFGWFRSVPLQFLAKKRLSKQCSAVPSSSQVFLWA